MYNLLTEPLIRYDKAGGSRAEASLPEVYAALMADEVDAFSALRPHQRHAWHAFLVQLGAMAMHRAGEVDPPSEARAWAEIIRGLTPDHDGDDPWQLVVDDITRPAFMQPPARSKLREKDYKSTVATPDKLDMLVTSKNHDLKSAVAIQASLDDWIFALITLQTMEGYGGRYNYGVSRMPSGYGNRPAFSFAPSARSGAHVKHDLLALMHHRQSVLKDYKMTDSGIGLLWVIPWDGKKAETMLFTKMDPFYIEVCRRVRLQRKAGRLVAARANSDGRRVFDTKGLTGDPWAPVSNNTNPKGTPPAFLGSRKFGYERVVDGLLSPDWKRPALLRAGQADRDSGEGMYLIARGMVRGEGGTDGYHERIIPLRPKVIQVFGTPRGMEELEDIARDRIKDIGNTQRILRHAIAAFITHGITGRTNDILKSRPQDNLLRKKTDEWVNRLTEVLDARFFEDLQAEFEVDESERQSIRNQWLMNGNYGVVDHARALLHDATESLPCPAIHRYKARVNAEGLFEGRLRGKSGLPFLFAKPDEEDPE